MGMTDRRHPHIQGELTLWYPMLQAAVGKLYVLSHFYNVYVVTHLLLFQSCLPPFCLFHSNSRPLFVGEQEQPSAYMPTLTLQALHGTSTSALNAPEEHPSAPYTDSFGRADGAQR
jgi:steroid 5-alpha reductase family enzyme